MHSKCFLLPCPTLEPCPDDGCVNTSCPTGLVRHSCAPCPMSCAHISSGTSCDPTAPCSSGQSGGIWTILCSKINCCFLPFWNCHVKFFMSQLTHFRLLVSGGPSDELHATVCVTRGLYVWSGRCALLAGPADEGGLWNLCLWEGKASEMPA